MATVATMPEQKPAVPLKLLVKLNNILGEIEAVPKLGTHEQGYSYQRASDIVAATRKVFAKHKVIVLFQPDYTAEMREYMSASNKPRREATVWFTVTFYDCETGESTSMRWPGVAEDGMGSDKLMAKVETSCMKTFLTIQFQIPDDGIEHDRPANENRDQGRFQNRNQQRVAQENKTNRDTGTLVEVEPHPPKGTAITVKYRDNSLTKFWVRSPGIELQLAGALNKIICLEWAERLVPATASGSVPATKFFEVTKIVLVDGKPPAALQGSPQSAQQNAPGSRTATKAPPEAANVVQPANAPQSRPNAQTVPSADRTQGVASHSSPSNEGPKREAPRNRDAEPAETTGLEKELEAATAPPSGLFPQNESMWRK
jgi:hypothetical protein